MFGLAKHFECANYRRICTHEQTFYMNYDFKEKGLKFYPCKNECCNVLGDFYSDVAIFVRLTIHFQEDA